MADHNIDGVTNLISMSDRVQIYALSWTARLEVEGHDDSGRADDRAESTLSCKDARILSVICGLVGGQSDAHSADVGAEKGGRESIGKVLEALRSPFRNIDLLE